MSRPSQILSRVLLSLLLLGSFVSAPFHHDHEEDPAHGHAQGIGHAHLNLWHPHVEIEASETYPQPQDWVAGTVERPWGFVAEAAAESAEIQLTAGLIRLAPVARSGHDPPALSHLIPRAPPA